MFSKIMVPVDLENADKLTAALQVAADLTKTYGCGLCYVGVTAAAPGTVAHNPVEYADKLAAFAASQAALAGIEASSHAVVTHDPAVDMDAALVQAVADIEADLVVIASHIPKVADHLWPSHGGQLARQSVASVFLVRAS